MNKKITITVFHDFFIFCLSFFVALWLRLDFDYSVYLFSNLWPFSILYAILNIFILSYFGLYHGIWRYASMHEILSIFKSVFISTLVIIFLLFLIFRLAEIPRSFPILIFIVSLFSVTGPRIFYRMIKDQLSSSDMTRIPVIVVGDNNASESFIRLTKIEKKSPYSVEGILGTKDSNIGRRIHNIPIVGSIKKLDYFDEYLKKKSENLSQKTPQRIIIADNTLDPELIENLYVISKKNGLVIGILPKMSNVSSTSDEKFITNPIAIEDVLGRKQKVHNPDILREVSEKSILVTGAGGSIGSELCRQLNQLKPSKIILVEENEFALYKVSSQLSVDFVSSITDVRDYEKIEYLVKKYRPDIIFHTAALKHITFVENEPMEGLKTNFFSTVKLCEICMMHKIKKMVFISTDKAVNPTNVMGATKRLCEKYIQKISVGSKSTIFSIVRFGNVLGSTGSVVPLFEKQIEKGGPITITHPKVTRYFMTIREAVELVLISSQLQTKHNGEIFILEMGNSVMIKELAKRMIILSGKNEKEIEIKYTGLRRGEKLNEELFFQDEAIQKTQVSGILSTTNKLYEVESSSYNNLITLIKKNNQEKTLSLFKKLLPEYKNIIDE